MNINIKEISEKDRNSVLHPFTQLKDFATGKLGEPTIVETGKGIRIQDAHGHQLIDGFAGLYCVNVGYGRTEVAEAISRQAFRLAYYHSYAAHTTDDLAILSDRLVRMAPRKMSKVFYGMSGSDALKSVPIRPHLNFSSSSRPVTPDDTACDSFTRCRSE